MLTRSVIWRLPALATMRRMSRADTGLAITPMQGVQLDPASDMCVDSCRDLLLSIANHVPPCLGFYFNTAFSSDAGEKSGSPSAAVTMRRFVVAVKHLSHRSLRQMSHHRHFQIAPI
jgi:hypothetical protein